MADFLKSKKKGSTTANSDSGTSLSGNGVKGSSKETGIRLPTFANIPPDKITDYSWCIYGEKGIGKSSLAAAFPDTVAHFMLEPCRRGLKIMMIPDWSRKEPQLTWPRFKEYAKLLSDKFQDGGRINLDTVDILASLCERFHAAKRGVATLNGINDHGKAWAEMKGDWDTTMNALLWNGFRMTFLSHARLRPKNVKAIARENLKAALESGELETEVQPTASGWAYDFLKVPVEFAGYYGYHGHTRVLHIRGFEDIYASAGCGEAHFMQPKTDPATKEKCERPGEPYHYIPMGPFTGNAPAQAYKNLCLAWDNKLPGYFRDTAE